MSDRKSPLERAVDLFVYAPLGLASVARRLLPEMIEIGRQQVEGQLTTARAVGEYAVQRGQKQASQTIETLGGLTGRAGRAPAGRAPRPEPAPVSPRDDGASTAARPRGASDAALALAIPDYDSLSASQVVPRLAGLSHQELEAVRAYESTHRGRKTILNRVAQLQAQ